MAHSTNSTSTDMRLGHISLTIQVSTHEAGPHSVHIGVGTRGGGGGQGGPGPLTFREKNPKSYMC